MRRTLIVLFVLCMLAATAGCGAETNTETPVTEAPADATSVPGGDQPEPSDTDSSGNTLVVYFSRTGNTQVLAEAAIKHFGTDFYRIEALEPYTDADIAYYTDCRADREQKDPNARPAIDGKIENIGQYDTIVLGYPIWHGQAPRIISTFLESYDFTGKTIIPFCTSASSGIGSSDTDLHKLCNAEWKEGKRFPSDADTNEFIAWLTEQMQKTEKASVSMKEMSLRINGTEIPVKWENNSSVAEITDYAANGGITVKMSKYGDWEQVGLLGRSFSKDDRQLTAENGDIMLYSGNQIVLFYGENTWSYTKLGHMEFSESEVTSLLSGSDVTLTIEVK